MVDITISSRPSVHSRWFVRQARAKTCAIHYTGLLVERRRLMSGLYRFINRLERILYTWLYPIIRLVYGQETRVTDIIFCDNCLFISDRIFSENFPLFSFFSESNEMYYLHSNAFYFISFHFYIEYTAILRRDVIFKMLRYEVKTKKDKLVKIKLARKASWIYIQRWECIGCRYSIVSFLRRPH